MSTDYERQKTNKIHCNNKDKTCSFKRPKTQADGTTLWKTNPSELVVPKMTFYLIFV